MEYKILKSVSDLKACVQASGSRYFDRDSMRFFGDTMANYYLSKQPVQVMTYSGDNKTCWELRRRRPVKMQLKDSAYFDVRNYERVHPEKLIY